jgi:peptidyl-prolyl cis-trans isomerase D
MLAFFRRFSNSWVMKGFFSLLIVSFSIWGIKDVFHPKISTSVIDAGSHSVEPGDFKQVFERYRNEAMRQSPNGQMMTPQEAVANGVDTMLLQKLTDMSVMAEFLRRMGLIPADTLITDQLKKDPELFNSATGKFDQDKYQQILQANGTTADKYQSQLVDSLAGSHFGASLAAGLKQPLVYGSVLASYELQGRTLSYFLLTPQNVQQPTLPTDQQLQAYIVAQKLRLPEMRVLTIVRFSAKALAPTMKPNEADLQRAYDQNKAAFATPEKRSLVQIPAKDTATAQAIAAKLQAGQAPDVVAKAFGVQAITYTDTPKSAVADPKVADIAFQQSPGQVSGPVQTALSGLAVIKVTSLTPAKVSSFEEQKPKLEAEAQKAMATQAVYAAVRKYGDAHAGGANLADSAKVAGGVAQQVGPVAANGADLSNAPIPGLTPKLMQEAFALNQGGETDLDTEAAGEYFAVHVDKIVPAAAPTIEQLRQPLTQYWMRDEMLRRLNAKADELSGKIKKGESFEAAAAEVHAQIAHVPTVSRMALMQNQQWGQMLAAKIFAAKAGETVTGQTSQLPVMVARVDAVTPVAPDQAARIVLAQRARASEQVFNDLAQLAGGAATAQIKPVTDIDRARSAIGASSDDAPKAASGTKPASGAKPAA